METGHRRGRQPLTGPLVHEPAQRGGVERRERQLQRVPRRQAPHQGRERLVRLAAADRGDRRGRTRLESPQYEREDRERGGVEPLPVVDRKQHRSRQRAEQREAGEPDEARVHRAVGVLEQQGGGERAPLRRRQPRQAVDHRAEQVVERRVRAAGLGGGRPGPQHERLQLGDHGIEQRRLADARLTLHEDDARRLGRVDDLAEPLELRLAPDDRLGERHRATLAPSAARSQAQAQSAKAMMSGIWPERQPYQGPTPVLDEVRVRKSRPES